MVTKGSPVTILSPGSLRADVYRLYRERPSGLWEAKAPQDSSNKASFPFESSSSSTAGQYQCVYHSRKDRSEWSDPLPLVGTGRREDPGPLPLRQRPYRQREQSVGSGGRTSPLTAHTCGERAEGPPLTQPLPLRLSSRALWRPQEGACPWQLTVCSGHSAPAEGGRRRPARRRTSRTHGRGQAVCPVGPLNSSRGGTRGCYDSPSSLHMCGHTPVTLCIARSQVRAPSPTVSWTPDLSLVPSEPWGDGGSGAVASRGRTTGGRPGRDQESSHCSPSEQCGVCVPLGATVPSLQGCTRSPRSQPSQALSCAVETG